MFALWLSAAIQLAYRSLPGSEYEAENQTNSGAQIGPDRRLGTIAAEASGRRAIQLDDRRQSLEFKLNTYGQGLTIRYALPALGSRDQVAIAQVAADGRQTAVVTLISRYIQRYGLDGRPETSPDQQPPRYWDEARVLLPRQLKPGTKLSIRPAGGSLAFAVDVLDLEPVPPSTPRPRYAVSVLRFGADATGQRSSRAAFIRAIAAARQNGRTVYVPAGSYRIDGHLILDRVTIRGAGPWFSIIFGHHLGLYSRPHGSLAVSLSGLSVESDVATRNDRLPLAAIGGKYSRSNFSELYLHHANVGIWLDGPAHDLSIHDVRIADEAADGINLHRGITRARVERNWIRNSGDDGIASWSERDANSDIIIRNNRITVPRLANGIAVYGGRNIEVSGNVIADTLTQGGGIHIGARFHSAPFSGTLGITHNAVIRSGSIDPHWHIGIGAIWLYALERPISATTTISDNNIEDAGCEAVQLIGPNRIDGVTVKGLKISGRLTSVLALQAPGSLTTERIRSDEPPSSPAVEVPSDFRLFVGAGNKGWGTAMVSHVRPPACI
jgi:hypothetical protein